MTIAAGTLAFVAEAQLLVLEEFVQLMHSSHRSLVQGERRLLYKSGK